MSTKADPIALNQTQAARSLGVSDRTLRNWDKDGIVTGRKVGGGVKLYLVEDLRRLAIVPKKEDDQPTEAK